MRVREYKTMVIDPSESKPILKPRILSPKEGKTELTKVNYALCDF